MLRKLILAIIVAVAVTLGLYLLGAILTSSSVSADPTALLGTIGKFLKTYGSLLGILAGLWFYFTNGTWRMVE